MTQVVDYYPLSPLQHGMLFHYLQGGRETGVDVEQLDANLHEPIEATTLTHAWAAVADRHPILRTRFRWEGLDAPRQEVVASVATPVEWRDISHLSPADQAATLASFLRDDRTRGFDLSEAPLWRVTTFRLAPDEHRMVWTYSHAILDSCYVEVLREVFAAYEAQRQDARPHFDERPAYRDHISWLQGDLHSRARQIQAFWRARLAGFATPTNLEAIQIPASDAAEAVHHTGHDVVRFKLSGETSDAIRRSAVEFDLRVSVFVEAAWALVLSAFTGEEDVVFGSTRACRRSSIPRADAILGLFINTVPVRAAVSPDKPLIALLRELRADQIALRPFEHTPLVDVVASAVIARGAPLFETIVVFNDMDNDARFKSFGGAWATRDFELFDQTNFPLNVMAYDGPEISFKLSYERRRFARDAVERIASLLGALLRRMAEGQDVRLEDLPRLPESDARALSGFNETQVTVTGPACIHEAFEAQVDRTPHAEAVVFRAQSLTYLDLDQRANRVASELVALGVGPETIVGLYVERSLEMVIGLIAILKAGGAYLPLDPTYPHERIALMLDDARAKVVLTMDRLIGALPPTNASVLSLDGLGAEALVERPAARAGSGDLAYLIFTSGSTGRPKGVQIEHRNVINFFAAMDAALGTAPGVWLALTSISFDIFVLEILWTLTRGFKVVVQEVVQEEVRRAAATRSRALPMGFSLFYFAADAADPADAAGVAGMAGGKYRLLLEGAKFADAHGFEAIWTPERHFHPFGGLYPNPSVTSAAVAVVTKRVAIRAGSVVLPLHNPIRCAEEWSVVDNLSNGRVGLSFASGWHASDFALAPEQYKDRREVMKRGIESIRALWRGETLAAVSGDGRPIKVRMYPPPVQAEPGIWITASGSPATFEMAGHLGARILTNLLVMNADELASNIAVYRDAYRKAGHSGDGHVTLMLHTFVGPTLEHVRAKVRQPFLDYLRTSTDLINKARWELSAFAKADDRSAARGESMDLGDLSSEDMAAILDHAFERYFTSAGLFGTPEGCVPTADRLRSLGVTEIACLIDFGVDSDSVLASLPYLDELRRRVALEGAAEDDEYTIAAQIRRHGVTHLQCTPSLLSVLASDDEVVAGLSSLHLLLVGGEALPSTLVERLQPRLRGVLRNMYGPTETTIWSTTSTVEAGAPITIGRPVANTHAHVVDRRLRTVPIGVPGELLIGGAGVARGYLRSPESTAERFVSDPGGALGDRLYRTGDLARWKPSGELEFLGRLDHQVKVRGYRVEPGEIEAVLGQHPAVQCSVVIARENATGSADLVAYFVPRDDVPMSKAETTLSDWKTVWDETYRAANPSGDFNTAGWTSSFTGEPIPGAEMREWVDCTVERVLSVARETNSRPRVLEIGCGTGMLLFRLAPSCEHYAATDFSDTALGHVQAQLKLRGLRNVSLERLRADELATLAAPGLFDAIVLNSVVQYFPDGDYLFNVLEAAYERLAPGGALFVGDVRSLPHLETFYTAIELARSTDAARAADVRTRVLRRAGEEGELVVDPRFFEAVTAALGGSVLTGAELKAGRARNEMTLFRYDAVLRKCNALADSSDNPLRVDAPESCSLEALSSLLRDEPALLRIEGIPNARLMTEVLARELLATAEAGVTVADLRARASSFAAAAIDPEDLRALDPAYEVTIEFAPGRLDRMDAVFRHRVRHSTRPRGRTLPKSSTLPSSYTNTPARSTSERAELTRALRDHLHAKLPGYMVPSVFVRLDALPLTPNGKIDRIALPSPERASSKARAHVPPENDVERGIVDVLRELLGAGEIGVDDNFFDLGANSLIMVQANLRLRALLGRSVPLVRMFQFPTARSLASALGTAGSVDRTVKQGQDRAQVRKGAMKRLHEARAAGRSQD